MGASAPERRRPRRVYGVGSEPDPRFTFANERTFLAWIRTGLALVAGGVAIEALNLGLDPRFSLVASLILIVAGMAVPFVARRDWAAAERALRLRTPLPAAATPTWLAIVVTAATAATAMAVLV